MQVYTLSSLQFAILRKHLCKLYITYVHICTQNTEKPLSMPLHLHYVYLCVHTCVSQLRVSCMNLISFFYVLTYWCW